MSTPTVDSILVGMKAAVDSNVKSKLSVTVKVTVDRNVRSLCRQNFGNSESYGFQHRQ